MNLKKIRIERGDLVKRWSLAILCMLFVLFCMGCDSGAQSEADISEKEKAGTAIQEDTSSSASEVTLEVTAAPEPTPTLSEEEQKCILMEQQVAQWISSMTLEQKVAQLFIVEKGIGIDFETYPVSGFIYFRSDLQSPEQTKELLTGAMNKSMNLLKIPIFNAVDEEGGTVTRIAGRDAFGVDNPGNMADLGEKADSDLIRDAMAYLGSNIKQLGFNVDFAPVADVRSAVSSSDVVNRAFSDNPNVAAEMVKAAIEGLQGVGVCSTAKHFPGLGDTSIDTHEDRAITDKSLEELLEIDFLPFQAAIEAGTEFIMVGHASAVNVDPDGLPSSISRTMITEVLRNQLGYEGIIITDAMNMGAIANYYSSGEAAVKAILAGADIVLMPYNFYGAYEGIMEAVNCGEISEERINESLERILTVKYALLS